MEVPLDLTGVHLYYSMVLLGNHIHTSIAIEDWTDNVAAI